jgi:hypothetical protein
VDRPPKGEIEIAAIAVNQHFIFRPVFLVSEFFGNKED